MKVITPGRKQNGWAHEFTCTGDGNGGGGCDAVLLVEQGDLYKTSGSSMGEIFKFITFKCAACGVETDIDQKKVVIPSHIIDQLTPKPQS